MTTTATTSTTATPPAAPPDQPAAQLRRLRWAVRATLTLGVAASVAANVLHARPNPISQIIAAWPPLALLLTVELISRVPHHRRALGAIRIAATAVIAGIATWVSYWHLVGVAARHGETEHGAAYLLPISVDGLVIVASVSLVEITARIRAATAAPAAPTMYSAIQPANPSTTAPVHAAAPSLVPTAPGATATPTIADPAAAAATSPAGHDPLATNLTAGPISAPDDVDSAVPTPPYPSPHENGSRQPLLEHTGPGEITAPSTVSKPARHFRLYDGAPHEHASADTTPPPADRRGDDPAKPTEGAGDTTADAVPPDTAAAVAYWRRRDPDLHPADIAARIGKSERTVRRYWSQPATKGTSHVNRHLADNLRR